MRAPEALRNDPVEAHALRLGGGVAEDAFGAAVPDPDHAAPVGKNDCVRGVIDNGLRQFGTRRFRHGSWLP